MYDKFPRNGKKKENASADTLSFCSKTFTWHCL